MAFQNLISGFETHQHLHFKLKALLKNSLFRIIFRIIVESMIQSEAVSFTLQNRHFAAVESTLLKTFRFEVKYYKCISLFIFVLKSKSLDCFFK